MQSLRGHSTRLAALAVLGIVVAAAPGWASELGGRIEGTVRAYETGEPLAGVNVVFLGTVLGTAAALDGSFFLDGIPEGTYRVKFSRIGYAPEVWELDVREGETIGVEVVLRETTILMSEVVVSAGKVEQTLAETPGSVSVVERDVLEERAATSLEQVLPLVSGVDLRFGQVSIRGSTGFNRGAGSRVLLLVDGFPAITGDTGGINWDLVPLWEIDRVEVVKGASSALYGSNAFGGVINVITRTPSRRPRARVSVHGGWYSRPMHPEWRWTSDRQFFSGMDGMYSRKVARVGVLVGLSERQSQGYRQNSDDRRLRATGRVVTELTPRLKGELYVSAGRETYGYFQEWWSQARALEVKPESRGDRVTSDKFNLAGELAWTARERVVLVLRPAWYRTRWTDDFHDGDEFSDADRVWSEARVHWAAGERHLLISGIEIGGSALNSSMFGDREAYGLAGFAQDEIDLTDRLRATLGIRWDRSQVRDGMDESQFSPKLAAVWRQGPGLSLRLSAARGFRAPSLAERFTRATVGGFSIVPNPDLRAESVWSGELGLLAALGRRGTLSAALFENRYRDLIQVGGSLDSLEFSNAHRARVRGLDLELRLRLFGRVAGRLAYCYQDHVDRETGAPLLYRPDHSLAVSLDLRQGPLSLGGDLQYQSRVDSVAAYPQDERVPLYLVNLRSSLSIRHVTVTLRVDNLLQYHFTPIERNLAPIRNYTLALTADL